VTLSRREVRWAESVGRTIAPRGLLGGVVDDVDLGALFREECRVSPWYVALLMRFSLWLTWLAPIWRRGRLRTFGALAVDEREALLEALLQSGRYSLRLAAMFLKLSVCTLLLGDARALGRIGAYRLREADRPLTLKSPP
jgi:hypothetical protein